MSNWAGGSTRQWRRTRAYVMARDQGKGCRAHRDGWCDKPGVHPHTCTNAQQVAHHTLGRSVTGDDPRYIVAACEPCNLAIGDPTKLADPKPKPVTRW
ncbi:MAG TPA: hypothetical protein VIQ30_22205 [Pseudonocardia sp.]